MDEHLNNAQLDDIKRLLDSRERTLQQEIRDNNDAPMVGPGVLGTDVGDLVDVGDDRYRAGMAHVDKLRDQEELMAIDAARARIADGSYGECIDCGQAIPFARLQAQPMAPRCVHCQTQFERTHPAAPLFTV